MKRVPPQKEKIFPEKISSSLSFCSNLPCMPLFLTLSLRIFLRSLLKKEFLFTDLLPDIVIPHGTRGQLYKQTHQSAWVMDHYLYDLIPGVPIPKGTISFSLSVLLTDEGNEPGNSARRGEREREGADFCSLSRSIADGKGENASMQSPLLLSVKLLSCSLFHFAKEPVQGKVSVWEVAFRLCGRLQASYGSDFVKHFFSFSPRGFSVRPKYDRSSYSIAMGEHFPAHAPEK